MLRYSMVLLMCAEISLSAQPQTTNSAVEADFEHYLQNGNAQGTLIDVVRLSRVLHLLNTTIPVADLDRKSTAESTAQLEQLPSSEIAARFKHYQTVYSSFFTTLLLQQSIDRYMGDQSNLTAMQVSIIQRIVPQLSSRATKTREWLTAIRQSHEEHYLAQYHLDIMESCTTPKDLWQSKLRPVLITKVRRFYNDAVYLNISSMTAFRTQLDQSFEDNDNVNDIDLFGR